MLQDADGKTLPSTERVAVVTTDDKGAYSKTVQDVCDPDYKNGITININALGDTQNLKSVDATPAPGSPDKASTQTPTGQATASKMSMQLPNGKGVNLSTATSVVNNDTGGIGLGG